MKKIILAALAVLVLSPIVRAQDTLYVADLKRYVTNFLDDEERGYWTDAILTDMLDLALIKYATLGFIPAQDTVITEDSVYHYALATNFIKVKGVSIIEDGRKKAMKYRALRSDDPALKTAGNSSPPNRPAFYSISGDTTGGYVQYYLDIDPPDLDGDTTTTYTIIVDYCAKAQMITSDSMQVVLPYSAIPLIVYDVTQMCFIRDREHTASVNAGNATKDLYTNFYNLLLIEKSEPDPIPVNK